MKRKSTNARRSTMVDPETGLVVACWIKTCSNCNKEFTTTSRTARYCCSECQRKHTKSKAKARKSYQTKSEFLRLKARGHGMGVEVARILEGLGLMEHKCAICGATEHLELHHMDLNYLNNTPDNLQWLCVHCHHVVHDQIDVANKDKSNDEIYGSSCALIEPTLNTYK